MTPGLAAADFSGLITIGFGREGIIDGGRICFGDFGGGDPGGSAGRGGVSVFSFGTCLCIFDVASHDVVPHLGFEV